MQNGFNLLKKMRGKRESLERGCLRTGTRERVKTRGTDGNVMKRKGRGRKQHRAVTATREAAAETERESAGNWDRLKRERDEWVRGQEAHLRAKEVESRLSRERREEEAQTRHEEERRMLREIVPEWKLEKMKREQERREEKERNIR